MKTSNSMALEYKISTHEFLGFQDTEHMDIKVQSHTSYTQAWASNGLSKEQAPLQQACHQHESVGEWSVTPRF